MTGIRVRRAFTLIELLVVVVIASLLAGIAAVAYQQVTTRAADAGARQHLLDLAAEVTVLAVPDHAYRRDVLVTALPDAGNPTLVDGTPAGTGELGYAITAPGDTLGLATRSTTGACVLARASISGTRTAWLATDGSSCTGPAALGGDTAPPVTASPAPAGVTALTATRGDTQVQLTWSLATASTSAPAADVVVRVDGVAQAPLPATATSWAATGLRNGTSYHFTVVTRTVAGTESSPASVDIDPRPAGVWDAALTWSYDGNTVCYGGASSWRYRFTAAVTPGTESSYRLQIRYLNTTAPGVSPWGGPLLTAVQPGLAGAVDVTSNQVCAPTGNPAPPFAEVKLVREADGGDVTLAGTGTVDLPTSRISRAPDGTTPPVPTSVTP